LGASWEKLPAYRKAHLSTLRQDSREKEFPYEEELKSSPMPGGMPAVS